MTVRRSKRIGCGSVGVNRQRELQADNSSAARAAIGARCTFRIGLPLVAMLLMAIAGCADDGSDSTHSAKSGDEGAKASNGLPLNPPQPRQPGLKIVLKPSDGRDAAFEVTGLTEAQLNAINLGAMNNSDGSIRPHTEHFAVYVGTLGGKPRSATIGTHSINNGVLRFKPRFPLEPGLTYTAVVSPSKIPGFEDSTAENISREFTIPESKPAAPTMLTQVYPTRDRLPANLLKFYLHFSAPMSQGESYDYIHLLDEAGGEIDLPFLELDEELWDVDGTRLTLLFDPGRIKQGLKPREDVGAILEKGKTYTLLVEGEWPDAVGNALAGSFRKQFRTEGADKSQPAPGKWKLRAPQFGTREPLVVDFNESLDHAMLGRVLIVVDSTGQQIDGRIETDNEETRWQFYPAAPWRSEGYRLSIKTTLEDLAGNSIGRPFEVDLKQADRGKREAETVWLPFETGPTKKNDSE